MLFSLVGVGSKFLPNISQLAENLWTDTTTVPSLAYLSLSLSINIILTAAIILRLLWHRHTFRQFYGNQDDRMYTFAVCIIVESALPYTAVAILTVVACGINSPMQNALLPMLGQLQGIPPLLIMVSVKWNRILAEGGFTPTPVQTMQFITDTTTFDTTATNEKGILDNTINLPSPPQSCLSPRSVTLGVLSNEAPSSYLFSSSREKHLQERSSRNVVGGWGSGEPERLSRNMSSSWSSSCTDLYHALPLSPA
ncbi:hypothetical protein LXA43DRAFT_8780 [Ganoderma leucocontextum]|nr:hypothetical protein LXA43DRAFT_8780 [Ganoderma leucocontextum]